jgi:hypothetical protein
MYRDKDAADSGRPKPETKTTEVVDVDDIAESIVQISGQKTQNKENVDPYIEP